MISDLLTFNTLEVSKNVKDIKQILTALPPYFGGKRKMINFITSQFTPGAIVVDLMAGALNVALASKALGHDVIANDRMHGPFLLGKALLENEYHKIDISSLGDLLTRSDNDFITSNFVDIHLPIQLTQIADNIQGNIEKIEDDSIWVYRYLLYRFLTHIAPFNMFRYEAFVRQYNEGRQFSKSLQKYANQWNAAIVDPLSILEKFALQINNAVIPGSGTMFNEDITDFLQRGCMGDLLYFDPPYYGARVKYERGYEVIDQILSRKLHLVHPTSDFNNKKKERDMLFDVLTYALQYETTVFSYWTKHRDREWFASLFEEVGLKYKEVPLNGYKYSLSGYIGGIGESSGTIQNKVEGVEILFTLNPK